MSRCRVWRIACWNCARAGCTHDSTLRAASLRHLLRHPAQLALALIGLTLGVGTIVAVAVPTDESLASTSPPPSAGIASSPHPSTGGPRGPHGLNPETTHFDTSTTSISLFRCS